MSIVDDERVMVPSSFSIPPARTVRRVGTAVLALGVVSAVLLYLTVDGAGFTGLAGCQPALSGEPRLHGITLLPYPMPTYVDDFSCRALVYEHPAWLAVDVAILGLLVAVAGVFGEYRSTHDQTTVSGSEHVD